MPALVCVISAALLLPASPSWPFYGSARLSLAGAAAAASPDTVATYADDCVTPKTVFDLGETVCAQIVGAPPPTNGFRQRRFQWTAPSLLVAQHADIYRDPDNDKFQIPTAGDFAQTGKWSVRSIKTNSSVSAIAYFVVRNPKVAGIDLSIFKHGPLSVYAGGRATYTVTITNNGPNDAPEIEFIDEVPTNMTFGSLKQESGPEFKCEYPPAGSEGRTVCRLAGLGVSDTATFILTYQVSAEAKEGMSCLSSASASSTTEELRGEDNFAQTEAVVEPQPCALSCPADIEVVADPDSCGAYVTYPEPQASGADCGPITYSMPSGSFFPIGTTTVTCVAETSSPCSFNVTVTYPDPVVTITGPPAGTLFAVGQPIEFTSTFVDKGSGPHTGVWVLGRDKEEAKITEPYLRTPGSANVTYAFREPGKYAVSVTVMNNCGGSATAKTIEGRTAYVVVQ